MFLTLKLFFKVYSEKKLLVLEYSCSADWHNVNLGFQELGFSLLPQKPKKILKRLCKISFEQAILSAFCCFSAVLS